MNKFSPWFFIPIVIVIFGSTATEATIIHDPRLFIASVTILALVTWMTCIAFCVIGMGRILR